MNQHSSSERRRAPRIEHNIPLKISSGNIEIITETRNLSGSGAYCRINRFIQPMTKLKINLLIPVKKNKRTVTSRISCHGIVVRTESIPGDGYFNTAIFFNDIQPKDSRSLNEFVNHMLGEEKDSL